MRVHIAAAALAALLAAPAARAEFEGVLEGRMTGPMSGSFRAEVGKGGVRSVVELEMAAPGPVRAAPGMAQRMRHLSLQRRAEPEKVYIIDEGRKSYTVIDTSRAREEMKGAAEESYTVRKAGKDKVAGFSCQKAVVTGSESGEMEMCLTDEIAPEGARAMLEQGHGAGGLIAALRKAGVEGYPVRWSRKDGRGGTVTMELTSARRQSIPASTFELPAGFKEQKGPGAMPGMGGNPAAQKQMEEALKNMSPEQRKQLEQMMKGQKGGQ